MELENWGRLLLLLGGGLFLLGGLLLLMSRLPILRHFGHLPGDIRIQGEGFACFMPFMSMCLLSLLLTLIVNLAARILAR